MNPYDIAFAGGFYELLLGFQVDDDTVPDIAEAPSQSDSFAGRPACQEQFRHLWPQTVAPQPTDNDYRCRYYYRHKLVDQAVGRILDAQREEKRLLPSLRPGAPARRRSWQ